MPGDRSEKFRCITERGKLIENEFDEMRFNRWFIITFDSLRRNAWRFRNLWMEMYTVKPGHGNVFYLTVSPPGAAVARWL